MSWLPEDKKTRPGYWIFSWPWKTDFDEAVEVHDRNTSKDSYAAKIGIPGVRVDEGFREQTRELEHVRKSSLGQRLLAKFFRGIVTAFSRWFTEGRYFPPGESIDKNTKIEKEYER